MVAIQPGSSGTFKSATAEGRFIEAVCFLQLQESLDSKNPNNRNAVTGDFSIEDASFSGSYALPISQSISSGGGLTIQAVPFLTGVTFSPGGSSPTFVSTTIEAYLLEVVSFIQAKEANSTSNPTGANNIRGNLNTDTNLYQGTFSLPVTLALNASGRPEFTAVEYLS